MIIAFKRFLPTVVIYVPVHLALGLPVGPELLWVLPLVGLLVVLAAGLAMIVAALQVYFRDLKSFMPYLLRVWLYGSPVLYYAYEMPEKYRFLLDVNPLGPAARGLERRDQPGPGADEPPAARRRRLGVRLPRRRLPLLRLAGA